MFMPLFVLVACRHSYDFYWLRYGEPWRLAVTFDDETELLQHENLDVDREYVNITAVVRPSAQW